MANPRPGPEPGAAGHAVDGPSLVVVGVDGSENAWHAFAWACGHARRARCPVLAVYVSNIRYWESVAPTGEVATAIADTAEGTASELGTELTAAGASFKVRVRFEHRHGDPVRELLAAAREHGADLLVVGSSAHLIHRFTGSLAARLAKCRQVPVVIVP